MFRNNAGVNKALLGYSPQSSSRGLAIPVLYGTRRLTGNILNVFNWQANPAPSGKGSKGSGKSSGNYVYTCGFIVGICIGPVSQVLTIWQDRMVLRPSSVSETLTIPGGGGPYTLPASYAGFFLDTGVTTPTTYSATVNDYGSDGPTSMAGTQFTPLQLVSGAPGPGQYSVSSAGLYTFNAADAGLSVTLNYHFGIANGGSTPVPPVSTLVGTFFPGAFQQTPWDSAGAIPPGDTKDQPVPPPQVLGYNLLAYFAVEGYPLGSGGTIPNLAWEINGPLCFGGGVMDCDPGTIFNSLISDPVSGPGFDASLVGPIGPSSGTIPALSTSLATAGVSTTLDVSQASSLVVGSVITFLDANQESVTVAGGYVAGSTTVPLTSAVVHTHAVGTDLEWQGAVGGMSAYAIANGLFCSLLLDSQKTAATWLGELLTIANSEGVWSDGMLKLRTRGDTTAIGNGVVFNPDTQPVYDLDDDSVLGKSGDDAGPLTLKSILDSYNSVKVEYTERGNQYQTDDIPAQDLYAIGLYGLREKSSISLPSVCEVSIAARIADTQLKYATYIEGRGTLTRKIGWQYSLLEPMDIVTWTDLYLGCDKSPFRLIEISESDDEDGAGFDCEFEVFPWSIATPTIHPKQAAQSGPGYYALPGSVNAPVFFEATQEMVADLFASQMTLLISLSGGPNWGGAQVWHSTDGGVTYTEATSGAEPTARCVGGSIMGDLTAVLAFGADPDVAHTLAINLTESLGALESVSQADADNFGSLCLIDQELLSFESVTAGSFANEYSLTYLRRGVYGSNETSHAIGADFVYLGDGSQFQIPYQKGDIGKTWYLKFTSFNKSGGQEQDLSDVAAYPVTITAPYVRGPIQWKPDGPILAVDPFFRPNAPMLLSAPAGSTVASVYGVLPPNQFSPSAVAPSIEPLAVVTVVTGSANLWPAGDYVAGLYAVDANGLYSAMSNLAEFTIPSPEMATVAITVDSASAGVTYAAVVGLSFDGLFMQGVFNGLTAVAGVVTLVLPSTIINPFFKLLGGPTPPDPRYSCMFARAKRSVHAGVFIGNILTLDSTSITLGWPTFPATNDYLNYTVTNLSEQSRGVITSFSPLGAAFNLKCTASSNLGVLTLSANPLTANWAPGDLILVRTLADSFSSTTIGCSKSTNPFYPAGMTVNSSLGNVVRIIGGTGAGQWRFSQGNTSGTGSPPNLYTVSPAWLITPDATSIFEEEVATWSAVGTTTVYSSPNYTGPTIPPTVVAQFDLSQFAGDVALVEVFAQDADGNLSSESLACIGDLYIPTQGPSSCTISFGINSGAPGLKVTPYAIASHGGSVSKCALVIKTSDPIINLTFVISQNGTPIINSTTAAATAAGTKTTTMLTAIVTVTAGDLFTIDITSGSSNWQVTAQLE